MRLGGIKRSASIICLLCFCFISLTAQGDSDAIPFDRVNRMPPPKPMFRRIPESTKIGKELLKPEERDYAENKEFLKKSKTEIAKIFPDFKCSKHLIDIGDAKCLQVFNMVGQGAYYSFRYKSNMETAMSEIGFREGNFFVLDFFLPKFKLLGFFVDLGDVPIESFEKTSPLLANLRNYQLPETETELLHEKAKLKAVKSGNNTFFTKVKVTLNNTYGLRLANWTDRYYGGEDNDFLIVLRVLRKNEDGSVIFIWRQLERKGTPKLKKSS